MLVSDPNETYLNCLVITEEYSISASVYLMLIFQWLKQCFPMISFLSNPQEKGKKRVVKTVPL